ncbi:MAG TPA: 30S ribosomal protein S8 [Chthoniobacterales bacterium]
MSAITDPVADFLTRLRNASSVRKTEFTVPYSKLKSEIARLLKQEGYINDYELDTTSDKPFLKITTKFTGKASAITGLKRVSKPGLRRYVGSEEIPRVLGGLGIALVSTSRGILTGQEARRQKVGGELLAYVW